VTQDERNLLVGLDNELADGREVFAAQRNRRRQQKHLRPSNRTQRAIIKPRDPGNGRAVIEPDDDLAAHAYPTFEPDDETNDVTTVAFRRHEVDQENASLACLESRLQDQSVASISSRCLRSFFGRDQPTTILRIAKQRGKARIGIKSRQAQPIDRAVSADESGRLAIPYQGVVFDRKRHGRCYDACSRFDLSATRKRAASPPVTTR
jgi:hypothetical protein